MSYCFDDAIAVRPAPTASHPGRYAGSLLAGWRIGAVPHGGYLVSVLLNACVTHSRTHHAKLRQIDPIHLSVAFVVKAQLGPCFVDVTPVKVGRSYSNYHVTLSQADGGGDGHEVVCVRGYCVVGNLSKETGVDKIITERRPPPPVSMCRPTPSFNPGFRLVGQNFEEYATEEMEKDVVNECRWYRFKRECDVPAASRPASTPADAHAGDERRRPMDTLALGLINDLMMPLPIRTKITTSGWFPTLVLDIQFKKPAWTFSPSSTASAAAPADSSTSGDATMGGGGGGGGDEGAQERGAAGEWCYLRSETETIAGGRFDISTRCYDGSGALVAVSRHAALIVGADRNLSKRSSRGKM